MRESPILKAPRGRTREMVLADARAREKRLLQNKAAFKVYLDLELHRHAVAMIEAGLVRSMSDLVSKAVARYVAQEMPK